MKKALFLWISPESVKKVTQTREDLVHMGDELKR